MTSWRGVLIRHMKQKINLLRLKLRICKLPKINKTLSMLIRRTFYIRTNQNFPCSLLKHSRLSVKIVGLSIQKFGIFVHLGFKIFFPDFLIYNLLVSASFITELKKRTKKQQQQKTKQNRNRALTLASKYFVV